MSRAWIIYGAYVDDELRYIGAAGAQGMWRVWPHARRESKAIEERAMKCETCGGKPADGVDLYRVNRKGEAGRWRCLAHMPSPPDPELRRIVDTVSASPPDVLAPPGYRWCPRTGALLANN